MRRSGVILFSVIALLAAVGAGYFAHGLLGDPKASTPPDPVVRREPVPVKAAEVSLRDAQEFLQFPGAVQSRLSVQVSARITAHIVDLNIHSGQQVKKGDVLVRLDDADVKTRIRQAEAQVGVTQASVRAAEAQLIQAQAAKVQADQDLTRYQELYKAGAAPQQQLQMAEAKAKTADAGVDAAQEGIAETRKQVAGAQAAVQEAVANLDFTVIHSPMDGVIVDKQAEQGDLAAPGRSLMVMQDPTALWFEAPVSESCARRVALGDPVHISIDAMHLDLPARITEIVPSVDVKSRSFMVRVNLPPEVGLKTGLFGRLQFPCAPRKVLSIPVSAKLTRGQLDFVFVVEGERARLRLITVGREQSGWVEVLSGLAQAERVVLEPARDLTDGEPVREARP